MGPVRYCQTSASGRDHMTDAAVAGGLPSGVEVRARVLGALRAGSPWTIRRLIDILCMYMRQSKYKAGGTHSMCSSVRLSVLITTRMQVAYPGGPKPRKAQKIAQNSL